MDLKKVLWLIVFIGVVAAVQFLEHKKNTETQKLLRKLNNAAIGLDPDPKRQNGYVTFITEGDTLSEEAMQVKSQSRNGSGFYWGGKQYDIAHGKLSEYLPGTVSKEGSDGKQHFVNSYLLGIHPFEVDNLALPLYALAQRKTYQLDVEQYGRSEVWQNSAEAFINLRGDCEDHAIVLADWLISEGVDAKVVSGRVPEGYHAWVVATLNGQEFILEATSKRYGKSWKHYPLASLNTDYEPSYMFNREGFWVNTDINNITEYSGEHWKKTSTFHRTKPEKVIYSYPR